ncbi:MAG: cysteine-rich CWC family protein [Gammaproteobacteria bacterium]
MANDRQHQPCWCREESFPQTLLDAVPPAAKHKACICKRCAQAHTIPGLAEAL